MSDIKDWSNTAANNNSAAPDGAPEGMNPSDVNNVQREVMAAIRRQHEDAQWIDLGHTPTYSSTTVFLISGDVTADYDVGRRVRVIDASTLYGTISASSYSSPNTSVTVSLDSGSLSASIASVSLGILSGSNHSVPKTDVVLGAVTVDSLATSGNATIGGNATVTGTIGVTGVATLASPVINTGISGTAILDEDDMASDSDTQLATQQSIKAYISTKTALLNTKILDIGDWNMDTTQNVSVAHGVADFTKIRNVDVVIRSDIGGGELWPLSFSTGSGTGLNGYNIDSTNITLYRLTSGQFDGVNFDLTSYNRGWITIQYVD